VTDRTVVLWRHGRTEWNAANRFQGQLDVPLDDVGREQAEHAARLLAGMPPALIVTSDLGRAMATGEPLERITGLTARRDDRLRETHGGVWQGRLGSEIERDDAAAFAAWRSGADVPAGGAERRTEVAERATAAILAALADVPAGGVLVAVTHGGTARAAIGGLLGLPHDSWGALGGLANCNWSVLEESVLTPAGWRLSEHNAGSLPEAVVGDDR
jgi:probable phosphoglycerate mutase